MVVILSALLSLLSNCVNSCHSPDLTCSSIHQMHSDFPLLSPSMHLFPLRVRPAADWFLVRILLLFCFQASTYLESCSVSLHHIYSCFLSGPSPIPSVQWTFRLAHHSCKLSHLALGSLPASIVCTWVHVHTLHRDNKDMW